LLSCGSFNPPHIGHMNMFYLAKRHLEEHFNCRISEGIISPVSDGFGKVDLAPASHRFRMSELAATSASSNDFRIRADNWECSKPEWTRTLCVLKHHQAELETKYSEQGQNFQLSFLCGADVLCSFTRTLPSGEKLWSKVHLSELIEHFGVVVVNRNLPLEIIEMSKNALQAELNISKEKLDQHVIIIDDSDEDSMTKKLSSTQIRKAFHENQYIQGLTDDAVIDYIIRNGLYRR